ncbi:Transposon TX1 uncharacterized 149 kDa protein [Linum grandiflorum]
MGSEKAPGLDGFNPAFYEEFWDTVGPSVTRDCQDWLQRDQIPQTICHKNIILLPKGIIQNQCRIYAQYLSTMFVTRSSQRFLANHLRRLMPNIIREEQSAFVQGRSIVDHVMIAFESIHSMTTKPPTKVGNVALKVDISKAYNRVEWSYLELIMQVMGYSDTWICWMMCVWSVQYTVVVNNDNFGQFQPHRGLRQG